MYKLIFFFLLFVPYLTPFGLLAQTVYEPIINTGIYKFMDGMAQKGIIDFNDNIRPVSRKYIAEKLAELKKSGVSGRTNFVR